MSSSTIHIFMVSFPGQGQINPLLRLAKRLASNSGFVVTFSTTSTAGQKIITANDITPGHLYPVGDGFLRFDFFDIEFPCITQFNQFPEFNSKLEIGGRKRVQEMLNRLADEGRPVTCLINGSIVPWVYDIADDLGIPVATLWAQSCASFLTFYYRYNQLVSFPTDDDPYTDVEIPTMPLMKWDELHSFLHPAYPVSAVRTAWLNEFRDLKRPFCILIDTFDELEHDIIQFSSRLGPPIKAVGPLFRGSRSASLIGAAPCKADLGCLDWLDKKPPRSVVYVSFGSIAHLKQEQIDAIAYGIMNTRAPFLWVMRSGAVPEEVGPDDGLVVEYSPQERVLAHPSVSCFVTHCGWNSTVEALTSGVPMVAFPQWGDQLTNTKFLVDVFGVAVRMGRGEHEDRVVSREEVERCIREATTGQKGEEMRRKAMTLKDMAEKAYQKDGSSDTNLRGFVDDIRRLSL